MAHTETKEVQHQTHLDSTVKLLTSDLSEVAARAGLDNHFQNWIEELKAANNPALHSLVVDMQALKATFGSGHPDLELVADLLTRLGQHTTEAASPGRRQHRPARGQAGRSAERRGPPTTRRVRPRWRPAPGYVVALKRAQRSW